MIARVLASAVAVLAIAAGPASAQVANWPYEPPPRPLPSRDVRFPPYAIRTLANGLQVVAVSHHEQPAVSLRLIVRAGAAQDPAEKPGVASFAASLLDQGTTSKSAGEIAAAIDSIGGALGVGAGTDLTFINAVVMKDSLDVALDLVADVARHPAFAPAEIERQRQQILSGLQVSYDDPDYIARTVFDRLVYGAHPYGRPNAGTPASVTGLTREDLLAFHRTWFGPNNAILAIVGDVSAEDAFAGAQRALGSWEASTGAATAAAPVPEPARRVVVVDRPGAVQTEIRVGNIALPRKHPDYFALDLALKILGGEGGNRLQRVLRSDRGLTYGASADTNALKDAGNLVAETDTRSETTGEALRLIVDEFWRLQRERVSERELSDAQAYLTGSFPLTIETPSAIALQVLNAVFYGLDLDELQTYRARVTAVTPDDIQRVARKYLHPDRLSIVLVGDASTFTRQLAGAGFPEFERVQVGDLDLTSDIRRTSGAPVGGIQPASFVEVGQPSDARANALRALIDQAVAAKGGRERLRSIRTVRADASVTVALEGQQPSTVTSTTSIAYPGSFRVDLHAPAGPVTQVFHNGEFWVTARGRSVQAPEPAAADLRANVQRDSIGLLLGLADGRVTARVVPDVTVGTRACPALAIGGAGIAPLTVVFDPETHLILQERYDTRGTDGRELPTVEEFSDYRDVSGLKVAFTTVVTVGGSVTVRRTVQRFQYNVPLDPALFTRPAAV